jgi:hypothetical protein
MVTVFAIAGGPPGFSTDVVARGEPVGVAVMKVGSVASTAVRVTTTPVAFAGTPPTPVTCTVIVEFGPTGVAVGTPMGMRVSRIRAGSVVTMVDGAEGPAVSAVWTPKAAVARPATARNRRDVRRTFMTGPLSGQDGVCMCVVARSARHGDNRGAIGASPSPDGA